MQSFSARRSPAAFSLFVGCSGRQYRVNQIPAPHRSPAALGVPDVTAGCGGESMEKATDFCFRTGWTAGSVVTTQIAIVRPMPPSGISSAYLPNATVSCARGFQPRVRDSINRPSLGDHCAPASLPPAWLSAQSVATDKEKKNQKKKISSK